MNSSVKFVPNVQLKKAEFPFIPLLVAVQNTCCALTEMEPNWNVLTAQSSRRITQNVYLHQSTTAHIQSEEAVQIDEEYLIN